MGGNEGNTMIDDQLVCEVQTETVMVINQYAL